MDSYQVETLLRTIASIEDRLQLLSGAHTYSVRDSNIVQIADDLKRIQASIGSIAGSSNSFGPKGDLSIIAAELKSIHNDVAELKRQVTVLSTSAVTANNWLNGINGTLGWIFIVLLVSMLATCSIAGEGVFLRGSGG